MTRCNFIRIILAFTWLLMPFAIIHFSRINQFQGRTKSSPELSAEKSILNPPRRQRSGCYSFDSRITPQELFQSYFAVLNDSLWLSRPALYSISFQELHRLLFGLEAPNLYEKWPNYFNKRFNDSVLHTSLPKPVISSILNQIDIPIHLVVEIGSYMGKSAINIGTVLQSDQRWSRAILLCIDTWLGALPHWVNPAFRKEMVIMYGRPTLYEQFIANIIANNLTEQVIPYTITSILGARFLLEKKIFPQVIFLDSAHLQGETYVEIELFWLLLQPGGILLGDDWSWPSVRCDVLRFIENTQLNVSVIGNTWFLKKKSL